ncbi:DUF1294 domain-containing protein [Francisellaceae bacterium]|nr:DUF1294 domain-containing protein [Francisellaceae bacterium]
MSNNSILELLIYFAIYYSVLGLICFIAYGLDKQAAKNNKQRIPEKTLHLLSISGGWLGAFIGQKMFHHKTRKISFQIMYWVTVVLNISFVILIYIAVSDNFK